MVDYNMLNLQLVEVEKIINSNYNFNFSNFSDSKTDYTKVMVGVLQARVIAEGICRFIVLNERIVKNPKSIRTATLKTYIDDLLRPNLLMPRTILSNLSIIQSKSNIVAHYQIEGCLCAEDAYICIKALEQVLVWFLDEFKNRSLEQRTIYSDSLNRSGGVPPKADGCIIPRTQDVCSIRECLLKHKVIFVKGVSGIGKTELIKEYISCYDKHYEGTYYIENVSSIDDYMYNMPIGIINADKRTKEEIIQEKCDVIHSLETNHLFVIDNYTDLLEKLRVILPNSSDKYHIIVSVDDNYIISEHYVCHNVEPFSKEDSLKIFRYFCDKYSQEEVEDLLQYVFCNTRAIKLFALFLRDHISYSPKNIIDKLKNNSSLENVLRNLYLVLFEISELRNNSTRRTIAEYLTLIPYTGFSKERFKNLLLDISGLTISNQEFDDAWKELEKYGWVSVDETEGIVINPLLSDTLLEELQPDFSNKAIVSFVMEILKPIRKFRDLCLSQVIELAPFVELLTRRANVCPDFSLDILNELREYYIGVYDLGEVDCLSSMIEEKYQQLISETSKNSAERMLYRHGISRFNLEDFSGAHEKFSRAIELINEKIIKSKKLLAVICSYEGTSLSAIGNTIEAIATAQRSISIREELIRLGYDEEKGNLWISHYNFAKTLFFAKKYEEAMAECKMALRLFAECYPEKYNNRMDINYSSLIQLMGRISSKRGDLIKAISLLEEAKIIREKVNGKQYFSTAQIYAYLMEVYCENNDYRNALMYAKKYYNVLCTQYKSEDILNKIDELEGRIVFFEENLSDA